MKVPTANFLARAAVWLACALAVALAVAPVPAYAAGGQRPPNVKEINARAKQLTAEATDAFKAKRYEAAADLFMQVYDLVKNTASVYNAARAKELGGKLVEAKTLFELYQRIEKSDAGRADAAKHIAEIDEQMRREADIKAKAENDAKAKAEADSRARQEAEQKLQQAEAKARDAELKAKEAEMRAKQESAAKAEAEARARAEAEHRARSEAEAKAREAELRAKQAEDKLKAAEERAAKPGSTAPPVSGDPARAAPPAMTRPPAPAKPIEPELPEGENTVLGGAVLLLGGGAHVQESGPDGHLRPDVISSVGALGHVGVGPRNRTAYVSLVAGAHYFRFLGFDAHADPPQIPSGTAFEVGLAFPRLAGLMATVKRSMAQMDGAGIGSFDYTTIGVRLVSAPKTLYISFGFEGLVGSSRAAQPIELMDELGYGPTARLFFEIGANLANAGLSK